MANLFSFLKAKWYLEYSVHSTNTCKINKEQQWRFRENRVLVSVIWLLRANIDKIKELLLFYEYIFGPSKYETSSWVKQTQCLSFTHRTVIGFSLVQESDAQPKAPLCCDRGFARSCVKRSCASSLSWIPGQKSQVRAFTGERTIDGN